MSDRDEILKLAEAKLAKVLGADIDYDTVAESAIPWERRKKKFDRYVQEKSREEPSKWRNVLLGGGALGAVPGAVANLGRGARGMAFGGGVGALAGAGMGALAKVLDDATISELKKIRHDPELVETYLEQVVGREKRRKDFRSELQNERRHQQLLDALGH